jgi:hypothetical protein
VQAVLLVITMTLALHPSLTSLHASRARKGNSRRIRGSSFAKRVQPLVISHHRDQFHASFAEQAVSLTKA